MRRLSFAAAVLALASGGCATGHAKTAPVPTPLDVPAPPPRIIVSPGPAVTPPQVQGINTDSTPPTNERLRPVTRTDAKLDTLQPAGPPVVAAPPVVTAPPAATLQQAPPINSEEVEKQVRGDVARAKADLKKVNLAALDADAKSQYDTAQRFVAEAEQALKEGNLLVAAKVAEKAAGLAAGLPVR